MLAVEAASAPTLLDGVMPLAPAYPGEARASPPISAGVPGMLLLVAQDTDDPGVVGTESSRQAV